MLNINIFKNSLRILPYQYCITMFLALSHQRTKSMLIILVFEAEWSNQSYFWAIVKTEDCYKNTTKNQVQKKKNPALITNSAVVTKISTPLISKPLIHKYHENGVTFSIATLLNSSFLFQIDQGLDKDVFYIPLQGRRNWLGAL